MTTTQIELNSEQRAAVEAGDGAVLVLAGAGSGKTRVIVERIVWLIQEHGIDPRHILAMTFTNKAAGEMVERVQGQMRGSGGGSWVGTFHSFGLYVLRRDLRHLGRSNSFTIFDDGDQLSLIKRLIKGLPNSYERVSPREALSWISSHKQEVSAPDADTPAETGEEESFRFLWQQYHDTLERAGAVDFDDLLCLTARLFAECPDVLERYRSRFSYILVDEYQDTNRAQYEIVRRLSGEDGNLFVVGDEDQAIYSWRGADLRNILEFEKDFPNAQLIRLEQNYRSTKAILDAANAVVAHNTLRLGKTLRAVKGVGDDVRFYLVPDGAEEARFIVESITERKLEPKSVAVLYRTNGQSRLLEEAFRRQGLAYVILGGIRFYARKEVKDLLCYLRLLVNPQDNESLRRIINVPPRGVGSATLEELEKVSAIRTQSLLDALHDAEEEGMLKGKAARMVPEFTGLLDDLAPDALEGSVCEVLERIIEKTDYREYVRKSDEKDFRTRTEVIDEFVSACAEYDKREGGGVEPFLQELALVSDVDDWDPASPAVTLMTCHSAKGLEFEHVFLVGLEEGLLPHSSSLDADEEVEEERRLCYVAMTRARESLILTAAASRVMYGKLEMREVSRFVDELEGRVVRRTWPEEGADVPAAPAGAVDSAKLTMGVRIRHARFGAGQIMYTSGEGAKQKVRIRFDSGMSRQFLASKAPLEILEKRRS